MANIPDFLSYLIIVNMFNPHVKYSFSIHSCGCTCYGLFKRLKEMALHACGSQVMQKIVLQKPIYWQSIKLTSQV